MSRSCSESRLRAFRLQLVARFRREVNDDLLRDLLVESKIGLSDLDDERGPLLYEAKLGARDQTEDSQGVVTPRVDAGKAIYDRPIARREIPKRSFATRWLAGSPGDSSQQTPEPGEDLRTFRELVLAARTPDEVAELTHWAAVLTERVGPLELEPAEGADQDTNSHEPMIRAKPPMRNANGKIKAAMVHATFCPCSLAIMRKLATQGMKSVIVTIATKT